MTNLKETNLEDLPFAVFSADESGAVISATPAAIAMLRGGESAKLQSVTLAALFGKRIAQLFIEGRELTRATAASPLLGTVECFARYDSARQIIHILVLPIPSRGELSQDETAALLTHDLKNPIGAIFAYADLLLDSAEGSSLSEKQRSIVGRVRSTANRLLELVRNYQQLLELEKLQVGSGTPIEELNTVAASVLEGFWREESSGPHLSVRLAQHPLPVRLNKVHIDRILSNLLVNALRYTPAGGAIELTTFEDAGWVGLRVHNTGSFIAPEEQARIFEKRTRGSNTGEQPGSGIGLYIVKGITEGSGGSITLESSRDRGTTFTVRLPLAVSSAPPIKPRG